MNVGGLSEPSKMPWYGWSISAKHCKVGGKLAKIPGSVCHGCYALKGRYVFPNVQNALNNREAASEGPYFVPAFIYLLRKLSEKTEAKCRFFRWFDSGDLQSLDMLFNINLIAQHTPSVAHWLPTKEQTIVRDFLKEQGATAPNLTVRLSAAMMGQSPPKWFAVGSSVYTDPNAIPKGAKLCPAPKQGNMCGGCRSCWNKGEAHVSYHAH
jgi:hypothetical protein